MLQPFWPFLFDPKVAAMSKEKFWDDRSPVTGLKRCFSVMLKRVIILRFVANCFQKTEH